MNDNFITHTFSGLDGVKHTLENNLSEADFELFVSKFSKNYPCKDSNVTDYPRPTFQLPDLSSPSGNTLVLFQLVSSYLKDQGFLIEAAEVSATLYLTPNDYDIENYSELAQNNKISLNEFVRFANLSKYIDFGYCMSWENYDKTKELFKSLGVYQSISPVQFSNPNQTQIPEFLKLNKNKIDELIISNFDFNKTNCYYKNILYYITEPELLEYVLKNTKANIAHIDHFSKPPATSILQNIDTFGLNSLKCYLVYLDNFKKNDFTHNVISNNLKANQELFISSIKNMFASKNENSRYNYICERSSKDKNYYYIDNLKALPKMFTTYTSELSSNFLKDLMGAVLDTAPLENLKDTELKNLLLSFEPLIMNAMITKTNLKSSKLKF